MRRFKVYSGYQQFYVADRELNPPAPEDWTEEHVKQRHNILKNIAALCPVGDITARIISCGLGETAAEESNAPDFEVRTSIEVPSGKIGIFGWPWELEDSHEVPPSVYEVIFKGYQTDKVDEEKDFYVVRIEIPASKIWQVSSLGLGRDDLTVRPIAVASSDDSVIAAHKHSLGNHDELMASELCGCFYCMSIFKPEDIKEWIDESPRIKGKTACCPFCYIDSVIGSKSGYSVTIDFLALMQKHWFNLDQLQEGSDGS